MENVDQNHDEYTLDIMEAIISIRRVEGDIMLSVPVDEKWKHIKYRKYPYDAPYYGKRFNWDHETEEEFNDIMDMAQTILDERIYPYLEDNLIDIVL